jgi:hypothetical protein
MAKAEKEAVIETPQDDVAAQLAKLGAELQAVAGDKLAREAKLKEVEKVLGNLQVKDFPDLAESPVIQSFVQMVGLGDLKPGEVRNRGTLAERVRDWSWGDVQAKVKSGEFQLRRFTPAETVDLIWNGLTLRVVQDQECEIPDVFYALYTARRRAIQQAAINERYLTGQSDQPPHPNWQNEETAFVRAWSMQGRGGTSGGHLSTGPIIESEGEEESSEQS